VIRQERTRSGNSGDCREEERVQLEIEPPPCTLSDEEAGTITTIGMLPDPTSEWVA